MKTFVFDLDGVIWRGREPLPHAAETVTALESRGHTLFYLTNNSRLRRATYVELLAGCGIRTTADRVMTSGYACRLHLESRGVAGKPCFVVGGEGLVEEMEGAGLAVDTAPSDMPAGVGSGRGFAQLIAATRPRQSYAFVVVGLDKDFHYAKLATAQAAILDGAEFLATNLDPTFPAENGRLMPGNGSLVAAVQAACGREPRVCGKPEVLLLNVIVERSGAEPGDVIVVGDRIDSDILMANRGGVTSALVLTGVTTREEAEQAPPEMRPTHIFETLGPGFVERLG